MNNYNYVHACIYLCTYVHNNYYVLHHTCILYRTRMAHSYTWLGIIYGPDRTRAADWSAYKIRTGPVMRIFVLPKKFFLHQTISIINNQTVNTATRSSLADCPRIKIFRTFLSHRIKFFDLYRTKIFRKNCPRINFF